VGTWLFAAAIDRVMTRPGINMLNSPLAGTNGTNWAGSLLGAAALEPLIATGVLGADSPEETVAKKSMPETKHDNRKRLATRLQ